MWGKLSNTQRFILIGVVVLTIVDLIMWANVAKLKNPFSRFEDALNAGNAKKAVECYQQMQKPSQKKNRSEAEKLGIKYAKIRVGEYLQGKAPYEAVSEDIYAMKDTVLAKDQQIGAEIEKMENRYASESAFAAAEEAKAAGDYMAAKKLYEQVEKQYPEYEASQVAIAECNKLQDDRARQAVEEAQLMIDIKDNIRTYLSAIQYLDEYIQKYPEDNFVPARKQQFMDQYYNLQLTNIDTLIMNKEPETALKLAKELKDFLPERPEAKEYIPRLEEEVEKAKAKKKK